MTLRLFVLFFIFSVFVPVQAEQAKPLRLDSDSPHLIAQAETVPHQSSFESSANSSTRFFEFGLEYPVNFGVQLKYLVDDSFYGRLGLGFVSEFFLSTFSKISPSIGYLSSAEAKLIGNTFKNSLYVDFRLGWAPHLKKSKGGPYIELGLSRSLFGSGELEGISLSQALSGEEFDELKTYSAKTHSYNGTVHIGYQIPIEQVKFNFEVGLVKVLSSEILSLDEDKRPLGSIDLSPSQKESFTNFLKEKGWIFPTFSAWLSLGF